MDIIFTKKQYKNVFFHEYEEVHTDDEAILYFEEQNQIAVMNKSAICIWNYLVQKIREDCHDYNITLLDLKKEIKSNFYNTAEIENEISDDITEVVDSFFEGDYCIASNDFLL